MKNHFYFISLILFFVCMTTSCNTSKNTSERTVEETTQKETTRGGTEVKQEGLPLSTYLRKSGVRVSGSGSNASVSIRGGASSMSGDNSPLFVLDGTRLGTNYSIVESTVDVNDIKKINILKGADASSEYGLAGANGVIEIITKSKN